MAVTDGVRFGLTRWSSGTDAPVNRSQLDGDNASVEAMAAGFLQDVAASRPAAAAAYAGFFFWATDTEVLSYCDGDEWATIPIGAFLALAGGILTGDVDFDGNEIQGASVLQATSKTVTDATNSGALVIDAADAETHVLTLTGNISGITVNNLADGGALKVVLKQDATGGRTIVWPAGWHWPNKTAPTWVTTANTRSILYLEADEAGTVTAYLAGNVGTV